MSSPSFGHITRAAGLMAFVALSSCVVESGPPPYNPGPGPGPQFCPRIYDPVCAERGRDRETFANACEARKERYRVIYPGQCRSSGGPVTPPPPPGPPPGPRPGPGPVNPPPGPQPGGLSCTQVYEPVCARQGSHVRTFGNGCEANVANYTVIRQGPC